MTATTTPTRADGRDALERALVERAKPFFDEPMAVETESVKDEIYNLRNLLIGGWHQYETAGSAEHLGEQWVRALDKAVVDAGWEAVQLDVIPAMARAAVEYLRDNPPPAHLVAFEGSDELRGDLETLGR